jgi:hypothetical protein
MITYKYYKFPDKNTVPSFWPSNVNVHEVGKIFDTYPVYNSLNMEVTPGTYLSGWHVNICFEGELDLSSIQQYEIVVNNPICKWFGQP